jgi:beta-lactamase regulating signal transducer with metallopeptidase domain
MSTAAFFLLQASLRGGVLILAVLVLRTLLRRLPKQGLCLLWTAVWLRLALPFALRSRFSLLPSWLLLSQSGYEPADAQGLLINQAAASAFTLSASSPHLDWPLLVWASGLAILLLVALIRYRLLKRRVREAIPLRDRLCLCDWVVSPFVLGLFRPRIYLPSGVEERDIPWIAAHEEAHLRRGDPLRKLASFLLTAIYWFQPLVWVAFFLYQRDLELACDEQAIRGYDSDARSAYVDALLRASVPSRRVWAFPTGFGSAPVRKRIKAILHPSGCGRRKLALAALLCAAILLTLTVEPVQAARTTPEVEQPLSESTLEAELPPSETASELPDAEQPESGMPEHSETTGWKIWTVKDGAETKWFLVANPSGDANVLLFPDGSSVVLYGEPVIICCDEDSGQTFAIDPVSREGDAP